MTARSRGSRAAAAVIRSSRHPHPLICSDCISHLTRASPLSRRATSVSPYRSYASAATAMKPSERIPQPQSMHPVTSTPHYTTKAGILLSRPPLLTAPQSPFEKAFYFYQKRLNERLAMPFTRYFYFKKDTPADTDWKIKAKERNWAAARELGGYRAYGEMGWNDEMLEGEAASAAEGVLGEGKGGKMGIAEPKFVIESLVKDSRVRAIEGKDGAAVEVKEGEGPAGEEFEMPLGRYTQSDKAGDVRRLDRKLERTLYLLVKGPEGWRFPAGPLVGRKENLHEAAERILVQSGGINMNTWIVGHVPIGHYIRQPLLTSSKEVRMPGEKTFFMKGRIMAGQADIKGNTLGLQDYKWLTREEVKKHVKEQYWSFVRGMMADR